ncbi:MAG: hypothetical protein LBS62_14215 [Clostridiales bacterium]|jgi:hypothetical protein|nr:hypothetical protein [Clostridiales bacterium]
MNTLTIEREPFAFAGFEELSSEEMYLVDGGLTWGQALIGAVIIGAGAAIAVIAFPVAVAAVGAAVMAGHQ